MVTVCLAGGLSPEVSSEEPAKHSWELGVEEYRFVYKEPSVMEDNGTMRGIFGSYTHYGWLPPSPEELDRWRVILEVRYAYGEVDYDGSLSDGTPFTIDDIEDSTWETRGLFGYDISLSKAFALVPYFGIGYRYLDDNSQKETPSGYRREANYYYSPIGVEVITNLSHGWSITAIFEYDIFWSGKQKSHLSDYDPSWNDITNNQNRGYGCRGSVKLIKKNRYIDFTIEPFIRYWNIRISGTEIIQELGGGWYRVGWEPRNNTKEYGVKASISF